MPDQDIKYILIRENRRSISLHFDTSGNLIVKAPKLIPEFIIKQFISSKKTWIEKLTKNYNIQNERVNIQKSLNKFLYMGKEYDIEFYNGTLIKLDEKLFVPLGYKIRLSIELKKFYISKSKEIITNRCNYYSKLYNYSFSALHFSDTTSKWGSCTSLNELQFSWRLIIAPPEVIDYVIIHELVHTVYKHHQKSFWTRVEQHKPAYKQYTKWLKNNAHFLHSVI